MRTFLLHYQCGYKKMKNRDRCLKNIPIGWYPCNAPNKMHIHVASTEPLVAIQIRSEAITIGHMDVQQQFAIPRQILTKLYHIFNGQGQKINS